MQLYSKILIIKKLIFAKGSVIGGLDKVMIASISHQVNCLQEGCHSILQQLPGKGCISMFHLAESYMKGSTLLYTYLLEKVSNIEIRYKPPGQLDSQRLVERTQDVVQVGGLKLGCVGVDQVSKQLVTGKPGLQQSACIEELKSTVREK